MSKKHPNNKVMDAIDVIIVLGIMVSVLYWLKEFPIYAAKRADLANKMDIVMGVILIALSLEVSRRALGNVLPILAIVMIAQCYFGKSLPGIFAHKGISFRQLVSFTYFTDGIFGTVCSTFATYVMPFLIFGSFLSKSGGDFFIEFATAAAGRVSGGPRWSP